jgi:hypothetical protein
VGGEVFFLREVLDFDLVALDLLGVAIASVSGVCIFWVLCCSTLTCGLLRLEFLHEFEDSSFLDARVGVLVGL